MLSLFSAANEQISVWQCETDILVILLTTIASNISQKLPHSPLSSSSYHFLLYIIHFFRCSSLWAKPCNEGYVIELF